MSRRLAAAVLVPLVALLAACAPEPEATTTASATSSTTTSATATPTPTSTATAIPADCTAIVSQTILAELADVPLNDSSYGSSVGVQSDGSLVCLWRDPDDDATYLQTTVSQMSSGPALDMLNELVDDEGFTCYTPSGGTRCEKTWTDATSAVTDGRTLFYRDGIMIDTSYSNLAPSGYTDSIVASLFG
ncbi:MAG: hypothetical protein QM604_05940 [Microbacterium sp.]